MKHNFLSLLVVCVLIIISSAIHAADIRKGALLFKQNHYNEAASELRSALPSAGNRAGMVNFTLGMNYQHSARLHAALQREAVDMQIKYLKLVLQAKGKLRSRYAGLYYGEALIEKGDYKAAKKYLSRISKSSQVKSKDKLLARINIGLADYLGKRKSAAKKIWSGIKSNDPEVLSELAAAYSRVGYKKAKAGALIDNALKSKSPSARLLANAVNVYADIGRTEDGLKVAQHSGLETSAGEENPGKNKEIKYFKLSLFAGLSELYNNASMQYLTQAAKDSKFKDLASYYQAESSFLSGDIKNATHHVDSYIASGKSTFMAKARSLKNALAYRQGNKKAFSMVKGTEQPTVTSELLLACARVKADCQKPLNALEQQLPTLQGRIARVVNHSIGEYYLRHGKADLAVSFLEEGRDKSRKNSIEAHDPVMLVSIAEAYGKNKLYSESLEIYFEMSTEFPVVRQIQDAIQGIYSTEQKSAGDVKIF